MRNLQLVDVKGEKVLTTSLLVAEKFKKSHKFVLRKIEGLQCSKEFHGVNFAPSTYLADNGKQEKSYEITEEGFMFIAMRFTGKEAVDWQEKFIYSFQATRKELTRIREQRLTIDWQEARANSKCIRSTLSHVVQAYERLADKQGGLKGEKPENRRYHVSITKRIYKELFGDGTLKDVRDRLDGLQLQFLSICEQSCADEIARLVDLDVEYHQIYRESIKRIRATVDGLSASKLSSSNQSVKMIWENPAK